MTGPEALDELDLLANGDLALLGRLEGSTNESAIACRKT